jgi:predicted MPP superfamily phosphohydrolase
MKFPNLPDGFHNFRIVQISDLHLGSYLSQEPMERAVRLILEQKPDVILFTGDLVNDRHIEAVPYKDLLKRLQAPHGVFSVLGNHDYGEYYRWPHPEDKKQNLENLIQFQRDLGWNLLLNEHAYLEKDGDQLGLIGVENWSSRMSFQRYGDMKQAMHGMKELPVNILMSHDPSHWKAEVVKEYPQVDLTLSGHTHGMQFGVEIPGFKWSPVQYVYKEWADLYADKKQYLYVNRGLGYIGYPGRVGILPEITVIDLVKG